MTISVHSDAPEREEIPPHLREDLRQRRPRAAAATEFGRALAAFGIKQRSAARWFRTSERNIRRWKDGTRKTPPGVAVVVQLILAGKATVADVELAAGLIPTQTNGAKPEPLAPLVEPTPAPKPKQFALTCAKVGAFAGLSPAAAAVVALDAKSCHWPIGDPQHVGFRFCGCLATAEPYCARHRKQAYLPPRTGGGHGVRIGFVAHGRHGRPSIPGVFSAIGASRAPISRAAPGKATQVPASPNTGTRSIQHHIAQAPPPT